MAKYYISSMDGLSGICKYSRDFFELVLKPKGFQFVDSALPVTEILSRVSSRDQVHIELGIFQKQEIEVAKLMIKANYRHVSVTLHDPPLIWYPFRSFKNPLLNTLSKLADIIGPARTSAISFAHKLEAIYVLSRKGLTAVKNRYGIKHAYYLPHIIDIADLDTSEKQTQENNLLYFGFIGKNKGVEYSLKLHRHILKTYPDVKLLVVGKAIGKELDYYENLRHEYSTNVEYLGYIPDKDLKEVFDRATFSVIPFRSYRFYWPVSGSVLYSLKKGQVTLSNNVNAVSEIIRDGQNGLMLTGRLEKDARTMVKLFSDKVRTGEIRAKAVSYLRENHNAAEVSKNYKG